MAKIRLTLLLDSPLPGILVGTVLFLSCQVQCAPTTVNGRGMKCLAAPKPVSVPVPVVLELPILESGVKYVASPEAMPAEIVSQTVEFVETWKHMYHCCA